MSEAVLLPEGTTTERTIRIQRRLDAIPDRIYRAWTNPDSLARWFPDRVEGSLAPGSRTTLVWARARSWWEILTAEAPRLVVARHAWGDPAPATSLTTTFTVRIEPLGMGSMVTIEDGPFKLDRPGHLDAWGEANAVWTLALSQLRAYVDFSVDLRERP
jgi:uncharacterized protein YndB with AHSA1/START domain